jgi:hypothetical protein
MSGRNRRIGLVLRLAGWRLAGLLAVIGVVGSARVAEAADTDGFVFPVLGESQTDPTRNTTNPGGDGWDGGDVLGGSWCSGTKCYNGHLGRDYYKSNNAQCTDSIGQPVYAVAAGTVVQVVNNPDTRYGWADETSHGWGRVIVIKHTSASGFHTEGAMKTPSPNEATPKVIYSLYAHLKGGSVLVAVGDEVTRGQHIADIGKATLTSVGDEDVVGWQCSHLHFEIKNEAAYSETSTSSFEYCCSSNYVPGVGRGYSGTDGDAPNRYTPSVFITNNEDGAARRIVGDWNGDGVGALWTVAPGSDGLLHWTIPKEDNAGALKEFAFGGTDSMPIVGDWDGDGALDYGVFRPNDNPSRFQLDINRAGGADWVIPMPGHFPKDIPIAGDWDGDGQADVGGWASDTRTFYRFLITGPTTLTDFDHFQMGNAGDVPIVGDWDNDGKDEVGIFRPNEPNANTNNFHVRQGTTVTALTPMPATTGGWGNTGDLPMIWDWNGDGYDTIGLFRPSTNAISKRDDWPRLTPPGLQPTISEVSGTAAGQTGATLRATISPNGRLTTAYFEYGVTTSYGFRTSQRDLGSGTNPYFLVESLTALACGTTYHFHAVAVNGVGQSQSNDATFTASPCATPSLRITSPNGGERLTVGTSWTATWTAQNLGANSVVSLGLSDAAAQTWTLLANVPPSQSSYTWTVAAPATATAYLYVWSRVGNVTEADDWSDQPFALLAPATSPLPPGLHQETDGRIRYTGTWTSMSAAGPNGGSLKYNSTPDATARFEITGGTRLTLYRTMNSNRGPIEVCIDTSCRTVQNWAASIAWAQPVVFDGLTTATHSVTIWNTSTAYVDLDAVRVELIETTPPTNPSSLSSASHTAGVRSGDNTIDMRWSGDASDAGSGVAGYSMLFDRSAATAPDTTVDVAANVLTRTSGALADGTWYFHFRTCDNSGNCAPALHAGPYVIDAVPALPVGLYQETDDRIAYGGVWTLMSTSGPSGAATKYTSALNDTASFEITGASRLTLYRTMNSNRGPMEVCVDASCQTVQNWSASLAWAQPWVLDGLSAATHAVTIRNASTAFVDLDAIRVELVGAPSLRITSPNGGERLTVGAPWTATWTAQNLSANAVVGLWLWDAVAQTWTSLANVPPSQTSYTSTVPAPATAGAYFYVWSRVGSTTEADDWSDQPFAFAVPTTPALPLGLHQETDSRIRYAGTWTPMSASGPSGGSLKYTGTLNDTASFGITGANRLTIYRTMNSNRGPIEVCVDASCRTVQNFSASLAWAQPVVFDGLTTVTHTVTIRNTSTALIDLDGVRVELVETTPPTNPSSLSGRSHTVGVASADNTIDMAWSGDASDAGSGVAGYSVLFDQSAATTPDTTVDLAAGVLTRTSGALGDGSWYFHLRTCDNSGNCAAAIHAGPYVVDAVAPLPVGFHQETDSRIIYSGAWTLINASGPNGGSLKYTSTLNNTASFEFSGTGVRLYRTMNTNRGLIEVCVDGSCQTVQNYSASLRWAQPVTVAASLANHTHTVTIRSTSAAIADLDAVEVLP